MEGATATSYDEELTPEFDPPVIEPPPPATLLRRIFAHGRTRPTVVRAPLVRVDDPQTPAKPDETAVEPESEDVVERSRPEPPAALVDEARVEARSTRVEPAPVEPAPAPAEEPAVAVAMRFCPRCGDRVPLATDGLSCHLGHRLSGAHRARRRWFRRNKG